MAAVLDEWLPRGQVLSIGDVWVNDLAPAHARGALTALVGSTSDETPDVTPTFSAHHLHDLYPAITEWLRDSSSSPSSPAPLITPSER
jgi:FMN phosphatase YigB (HAD superfamily)